MAHIDAARMTSVAWKSEHALNYTAAWFSQCTWSGAKANSTQTVKSWEYAYYVTYCNHPKNAKHANSTAKKSTEQLK